MSNNLKYDTSDIYDGVCTEKQYYDQFNTARVLVVGGKYETNVDNFMRKTWEIIYINEDIALAVSVDELSKGDHMLFNSSGDAAGWRYSDNRPSFRLRPLK